MTLYFEFSEALRGPSRGGEMERVLRVAAASGLTPTESLNVLEKLYDEAGERGDECDLNLIGDFAEIAKNYCQPECRIWSLEETSANNEMCKGFWK